MTRTLNRNATAGYNAIMGEFRMGDADWYSTMGLLFALAEVAYVMEDEIFPGFRPAPYASEEAQLESIQESYPDAEILEMSRDETITLDDMRQAFTVLSRYADWTRPEGE